jgi:hypothetical protein
MSRLSAFVALSFAVAIGCGAYALGACKQQGDTVTFAGCPSAEPSGKPIATDVMAFLSAARVLHHEANIKEDEGDLAGAIAPLEQLVTMRAPQAPEVDEVLADTYARLAEVRVRTRDLDGASKDVELGLGHAHDTTYFRGHLLEVSGLVEEARAAQLADAGQKDEMAKAKARAIGLFHDAVTVQEEVIRATLADKDGSK